MDRFIGILFIGIFVLGAGVYMSITLSPYDCKLLPSGFWFGQCQTFNLQLFGLKLLSFGLGVFTFVIYFKALRDKIADNPFVRHSKPEVEQ